MIGLMDDNKMNLIQFIVGSSTPDGEAPLSQTGVIAFVLTLTLFSITWAIINFFLLIKKPTMYDEEQANLKGLNTDKTIRMAEACQKVIQGSLTFLKFNYAICLIAGIIFFLIIMGAIENFDSFGISIAYILGLISSIILGVVTAVASGLSLSRICSASSESMNAVYLVGKNISNFVGYFVTGITNLFMFLLVLFSQKQEMNSEDLTHLGAVVLAFSFGSSTVAIGTKINAIIYAKGAESSFHLIADIQNRVKQDDKNPMVLCKAIGQNLNKAVANALDYTMYVAVSIAATTAAAASNVNGVDQKGQIIFDSSVSNIYLPLLAVSFMLFFSVGASVAANFLFGPTTGDEAAIVFKRQIYIQIIFLSGFLSLAAYLALPAEFWVNEHEKDLREPYMAYLCMLIPMILMFLLMIVAELQINHPKFIYSLINASTTGAATNIISGLAFGYFGNAIPIITLTGVGFLAYFWLGSFGVGLLSIGLGMLFPNNLAINTFFVNMENSSLIAVYSQATDQMITNMMEIAQNRRIYQPQVHLHLNCLAIACSYCLFLIFTYTVNFTEIITLNNPQIFSGLIIGGMLAYTFSSMLIRSIHNVAPVLCYDIKAQVQETPGIIDGHVQPDYARANYFYSINTILQMKFFLPFFFGPFVLLGIAFGPKIILGAMIGIIISGIQLSLSSNLSGHIWTSARTEIFLGKAKDDEQNQIKPASQTGVAASVGNDIGIQMKDAVGLGVHGYVTYVCLSGTVFATLYSSIHS